MATRRRGSKEGSAASGGRGLRSTKAASSAANGDERRRKVRAGSRGFSGSMDKSSGSRGKNPDETGRKSDGKGKGSLQKKVVSSKKSAQSEVASSKKVPVKKALVKKAPAKKLPLKKAPAKKAPTKPAKKAPAKPAKPAKLTTKAPTKKAPARKTPAKAAARKAPVRKAPVRKAVPARKAPAGKVPSKAPPRKAPVKKTSRRPPRKPQVEAKRPEKPQRTRKPSKPSPVTLPVSIGDDSVDAERVILDKLLQAQIFVSETQPKILVGIKSFLNQDGSVDGEIRLSNLPEEWTGSPEGLVLLNSFLSDVMNRVGPITEPGSYWVAFGVRFGPSSESEAGELAEIYKRFRGLFQAATHATPASIMSSIITNITNGLAVIVRALMVRRGSKPSVIFIRFTFTPDGARPQRYEGERPVSPIKD